MEATAGCLGSVQAAAAAAAADVQHLGRFTQGYSDYTLLQRTVSELGSST